MPVKIITTGLPQVRVEDSGTPLSEGFSRAAETLLGLAPRLAQIQAERERQQQSAADTAAFREGQLSLDRQRLGKEGERIGLERARILMDANRGRQNRVDDLAIRQQEADRRLVESQARGFSPIPAEQQSAPSLLGGLGRVTNKLFGWQPDAAKSDIVRLQEANLGKLAAQTQDISGRNPARIQAAEAGAGARNEATQARENTAMTALIQKESDAAVQHALRQKQMQAASQGGDLMSVTLTPEEEMAVRSATEQSVRQLHGSQPRGVAAPQQQEDPWNTAIRNAFGK